MIPSALVAGRCFRLAREGVLVLQAATALVSVHFPHRSLFEGRKLLQTPEVWGSGPLLPFAMPCFTIEQAQGPVMVHKRAAVLIHTSEGHKCRVMFCKDDPDQIYVCVGGDEDNNKNTFYRVHARVFPFCAATNTGFVLTLRVESEDMRLASPAAETGDLKDQGLRASVWWSSDYIEWALQNCLFQAVDMRAKRIPALEQARQFSRGWKEWSERTDPENNNGARGHIS